MGGGGHYEGLVRLVHALWSSMYKWRDVWGGGGDLSGSELCLILCKRIWNVVCRRLFPVRFLCSAAIREFMVQKTWNNVKITALGISKK
jgi:hypothetical protein